MNLREQLAAAMTGEEAPAEVIETPQAGGDANGAMAEAGGETGAVEAATPEPVDTPARPVRDEQGRFKPKHEQQQAAESAIAPHAEAQSETAKPAGTEPQTEAIRIPPSLPAAVKAKFAKLDPDVQQAVVALESSVQQAKAEWGKKGERLNRFDEILAPHVDRWRLNGLDEVSGVQALLAAQNILDRNPVEGLLHVARSYGLTPAHLAQAFGLSQTSAPQGGAEAYGQPAQTDLAAALRPVLDPLTQQVRTIQQQFERTQQAQQDAMIATAQRDVEAFAADPANMYFENVSDALVDIIAQARNAGREISLKEAYDRAIWADPEIRPLLLDAQATARAQEQNRVQEEARKAAETARRNKAQGARYAGGSITGSPTAGAGPTAGPQGSVRDSLRAAFQEHSSV